MDSVLFILSAVAVGIGFVGLLELLKDHRNQKMSNDFDKDFKIDFDPDENNQSNSNGF